jgi:uncharacterized membrane protein
MVTRHADAEDKPRSKEIEMRRDTRWLWIGLGVLALLVLFGPLGHGFGSWPGPHQVGVAASAPPTPGFDGGPWGPRGGGFAPSFGGLVLWAAIIVGVIMLSRNGWSFRRTPRIAAPPTSAEDVLRWRYATGEISREEYLEMSRVVRGVPEDSGAERQGTA